MGAAVCAWVLGSGGDEPVQNILQPYIRLRYVGSVAGGSQKTLLPPPFPHGRPPDWIEVKVWRKFDRSCVKL